MGQSSVVYLERPLAVPVQVGAVGQGCKRISVRGREYQGSEGPWGSVREVSKRKARACSGFTPRGLQPSHESCRVPTSGQTSPGSSAFFTAPLPSAVLFLDRLWIPMTWTPGPSGPAQGRGKPGRKGSGMGRW